MAEEEDFIPFEDISKLKKGLEGIKEKKDVSAQELYEAVQKLAETITDMLEVFGAAAEQMKLEEKEYDANSKKQDLVISRLDKMIDQNKTIAEAMVGVVDMIKEKLVAPAKQEEQLFKPRPEPMPFMRPQPEWQPRPEPMMPRAQPLMPPTMPTQTPPMPDLDLEMPPMEPTPPPDLNFPEEPLLEEEPKKKGLFGMFKK